MENFNRERRRMREEVRYLRDLVWRLTEDPSGFPLEYCECGECAASEPAPAYVRAEAYGECTGTEDLVALLLLDVN